MPVKTTLLTVAGVVCFAAAYRFGAHGIRLNDHLCIGLAVAGVAVGSLLMAFAFRSSRRARRA